MPRLTPVTAADVFQDILEYCDALAVTRGYWGQAGYKLGFFRIFYNAYANGRAGVAARSKYITARKRKKSTTMDDWVVHGENIPQYLKREWPRFRQHRAMIKDLCRWWDDWAYCLDASPREIRRAYIRKDDVPGEGS